MPNREGGKKVRHRMLVGLVTAVLFSVLPYSPQQNEGNKESYARVTSPRGDVDADLDFFFELLSASFFSV